MILEILTAAVIYGGINTDSSHGRIGILYNHDAHTVIKVYSDSPASRAGLKKKDKIIKIVDYSAQKHPDIHGPSDSMVELTVERKLEDGTVTTFTVYIIRVPWKEVDTRRVEP